MPCCSQYFIPRNVPQRVDGGERTTGTVRGYKLVSQFRLAGNLSVYLVVNVHLVHKVLTDVAKKLMQIRVVVVDVAGIWCMVVVLIQDSEGDTAVDAQAVDGYETLVSSLLLHDAELSVFEVLRRYANQVAVSLAEVAT